MIDQQEKFLEAKSTKRGKCTKWFPVKGYKLNCFQRHSFHLYLAGTSYHNMNEKVCNKRVNTMIFSPIFFHWIAYFLLPFSSVACHNRYQTNLLIQKTYNQSLNGDYSEMHMHMHLHECFFSSPNHKTRLFLIDKYSRKHINYNPAGLFT